MHRLCPFLAEKNPDAARRAARAMRAGVKVIAQQPCIGTPAEELEPAYRKWLINFGDSSYRS